MSALDLLPQQTMEGGSLMLEFGCGAGMYVLHLVSVLSRRGIDVVGAIGTDFSPVLIEAAMPQAKNYLWAEDWRKVQFCLARNQTSHRQLVVRAPQNKMELENSFHFILGVNTIRYCHAAKRVLDCARNIFSLLVPGVICVVIDMNNRFPFSRSHLRIDFADRRRNSAMSLH
jgi:SAM-dependent methyltransferase